MTNPNSSGKTVSNSRRALMFGAAAAVTATPVAARSRTGRVVTAAASISGLRSLDTGADAAQVLGYRRPGDLGGGLFVWTPGAVEPDDGGMNIAPSSGSAGRWKRQHSGTIDIRWFGAASHSGQDSAPAIIAALEYAAAQKVVPDVYIPAGSFLVSRTILVPPQIRRIFGEGTLHGNIRRFGPIDGPISPSSDFPTETDFGCLSGAGLYFAELAYHLSIEGITFANFRFALAWFTAHNSPSIERCAFVGCNVAAIFYQGCQTTHFVDCSATQTNVFVIAAATCFGNEHPLRSRDNFYCDGLTISNTNANRRHAFPRNDNFDDWFEASILRPDELSYSANSKNGAKLAGTEPAVRRASGRLVYLPFRNPRICFSLVLNNLDFGPCGRGVACVNTELASATFTNIVSEAMFSNPGEAGEVRAMFMLGQGADGFARNIMIGTGIGIDRGNAKLISWLQPVRTGKKYWTIIGGYPEELDDDGIRVTATLL